MKKIILLVLSFCLLLPVWASAQEYGAGYSKAEIMKMVGEVLNAPQEDPAKVFRCPTAKISNQEKCLTCHVAPSFKVRESDPDDLYKYPNYQTKIRTIGGKKVGTLFVSDIDGKMMKESLDYFDRHDISHIIIEIHSGGGSLFEGWRCVGLMGEAEKNGKILETRVYGFAASAAMMVAVSGTKGHRFANSHAELMAHELYSFKMFSLDTPSSSEEATRVLRHLQDTGNSWLSSRSNLTKEEMDKKTKNREFWMTGAEALEYGFIDGLLNVK